MAVAGSTVADAALAGTPSKLKAKKAAAAANKDEATTTPARNHLRPSSASAAQSRLFQSTAASAARSTRRQSSSALDTRSDPLSLPPSPLLHPPFLPPLSSTLPPLSSTLPSVSFLSLSRPCPAICLLFYSLRFPHGHPISRALSYHVDTLVVLLPRSVDAEMSSGTMGKRGRVSTSNTPLRHSAKKARPSSAADSSATPTFSRFGSTRNAPRPMTAPRSRAPSSASKTPRSSWSAVKAPASARKLTIPTSPKLSSSTRRSRSRASSATPRRESTASVDRRASTSSVSSVRSLTVPTSPKLSGRR